jgi:hypothetical protein
VTRGRFVRLGVVARDTVSQSVNFTIVYWAQSLVSFILIFINPLSFNTSLALKTERVDIAECLDSVETATENVVWAHLPA